MYSHTVFKALKPTDTAGISLCTLRGSAHLHMFTVCQNQVTLVYLRIWLQARMWSQIKWTYEKLKACKIFFLPCKFKHTLLDRCLKLYTTLWNIWTNQQLCKKITQLVYNLTQLVYNFTQVVYFFYTTVGRFICFTVLCKLFKQWSNSVYVLFLPNKSPSPN